METYRSLKVSECNKERTTPKYIVVESDVIELDHTFYKTAIHCEQQGLPSCLGTFIRSQDVSKDGKISLAELTRSIRHLGVRIGISNEMSFDELVGASAGTQLLSPLLAKISLLNYDNDHHLSVSGVLHDFSDLGGSSISREDIRSRFRLEGRLQEFEVI